MQNDSGKVMILDMLDLVRRNWWTLIAGLSIGLTGAVVALSYMPKVYEARARIYQAPPKIPTEYVDTNVQDDMTQRLWRMHEAVISEEYMLELITREFTLPQSKERQEKLIRRIRAAIDINVADQRGYFELSYKDGDPDRAARVANILSDLFIQESKQTRTDRARSTTQIMRDRAEEIGGDVEKRRTEIEDFRFRHRFELESYLDANWRTVEGLERDLENIRGQIEKAQDRVEQLQTSLALQQQPGAVIDDQGLVGIIDPNLQKLRQLERDLESLLVHYSEKHPEVKAKRREIEDQRALIANTPVPTGDPGAPQAPADEPVSPAVAALRAQIDQQTKEIIRLRQSEQKTEADIATVRGRIERTPANEQRMAELQDGYSIIEGKYRELMRKADDAESTQWLEESQHGSQFEIISLAEPPAKPISPQPLKIYVLGLVAGLALFVAPMLGYRFLNPVLGSEAALESSVEVPVLVSIPRIHTEAMVRVARGLLVRNIALSMLALSALVFVFVTFR